jgi:carboxylesterase type B
MCSGTTVVLKDVTGAKVVVLLDQTLQSVSLLAAMMLPLATALVAALSTAVTAQSYSIATHSNAPIVDLGYVKYAGVQNATIGIDYFRGIPFAQPPVGELRWQKPRPIELGNNFTGKTVNATKIAPWCWQSYPLSLADKRAATVEAAFINQPQSEDCLILDVLVPSKPKTTSLPVLVQIHGYVNQLLFTSRLLISYRGGYVSGSAQSYPGDGLVNGSNGQIIYVSLQYRLGMFGFLAGAEVMANGVANAGLLDQRLALEWVQRNIRGKWTFIVAFPG